MRNIEYDVDLAKELLKSSTCLDLTVPELMHFKNTYNDVDELIYAAYVFGLAQCLKSMKGGDSDGKE